jgi:hypothetical protein
VRYRFWREVILLGSWSDFGWSNDGNPLETGAGAVSKDKKAPSAQLGDAMVFGEGMLYFCSCEPYSTSNKTEY